MTHQIKDLMGIAKSIIPEVFSKDLYRRHVKTRLVWERVKWPWKRKLSKTMRHGTEKLLLSQKNLCFKCNIAITNFLVSYTCEMRFHDLKGQGTVHIQVFIR